MTSRLQFNSTYFPLNNDYNEEPPSQYEASSDYSDSTNSILSSGISNNNDNPVDDDVFLGFQNTQRSLWSRFTSTRSSRKTASACKVVQVGKLWIFLGKLLLNVKLGIAILFVSVCLPVVLMGLSLFYIKPVPHFDISLDAFEIPNHVTSQRQDAFNLASKETMTHISHLKKRSNNQETETTLEQSAMKAIEENVWINHRQRREVSLYRSRSSLWRMEVVFVARGDDNNIFTEDRLLSIHEIEMKIVNHKDFTKFCTRSSDAEKDPALKGFNYCSPLNSLMTFFFPSQSGTYVWYDGMGSELADIEGALEKAMSSKDVYYYVDQNMNSTHRQSTLLRTEVLFGQPIGDVNDPPLSREEQDAEFKKFIVTYIDMLDKESTSEVKVLYGGTEIFDYEVQSSLHHDLLLSIITLVLIVVVLLILTSFSLWLTTWGILSVLLSFCWAFSLYRMVFLKTALGMLNAVSVFIVIGIGVDDVFVFMNTYRQSAHLKDPVHRMGHTIKRAGTATFFTSITTAGAFAANMSSQIPAIHDFGLFMSLIVSFCWFTVVTIMPSALNLWGRYFLCEGTLLEKCTKGNGSSRLYQVLADYEQEQPRLTGTNVQTDDIQLNVNQIDDDSDIQMLNIEEDSIHQDFHDVELLDISSQHHGQQKDWAVSNLTKCLEVLLARFVAEPVTKFRWVIIVCFLLLVGASVSLVVQIQPASRPPTFYSKDSNLQELIDLAYNFSSSNIHCSKCSGFYQSGSQVISRHPPTVTSDHGKEVDVVRPTVEVSHAVPWSVATNPPPLTSVLPMVQLTTVAPPTTHLKTCSEIICPRFQRCHMISNEAICSCNRDCISDGPQVCASDGQTFINKCTFNKRRCDLNDVYLIVIHSGPCKKEALPTEPSHHVPSSKPLLQTRNDTDEDENSSPGKGYNPCKGEACGDAVDRPIIDNMALVYVVFGIEGISFNTTTGNHVLDNRKGEVIFSNPFKLLDKEILLALCRICQDLGTNENLVFPGGAECFPRIPQLETYLTSLGGDCVNLPQAILLKNERSKSIIGLDDYKLPKWFAMAFESKIYMGKSSFLAYNDYLLWEAAVKTQLEKMSPDEATQLGSMFQTCGYWQQVFMEVIGVTSAVYGLAFSLLVCIVAVVLFTGHIILLIIVLMTIFGVIILVVAMFYLMGWQMGAVEAVSLSILVGSSVDYCVHLVEGYLMAGELAPDNIKEDNKALRCWRTSQAISSIGVSIFSSALTTIIAAVPLCFTSIQPFSKFGKIVAMNTFVSILYTMTACTAFLSCFAPAKYKWNVKWFLLSSVIVMVLIGAGVMGLYGLHLQGVKIPSPSGSELF